ncbi:KxYKxGKxW signal peptide domain-containing protein [Streptococcus salivarius]|uniref:KxYKxGKxW signal peptide domain-containing protein n=1 Tax=Streptococcus salivarius TaxID=1304 RepID=UPI0020C90134|nr:KxYKxGKxW signal peptide domain-containing protein [Streptococcus salivarius]MCP9062892.1 KxYKxGKxW signal peptide domain-containing protein [Streptococcus salivarius]MCP9064805.1 KxYKxGKxW signal peptide domain-containing protein [Streptococcus salivarius]
MENKVRFKLHKVKKHWITIAATSLAIGVSLIGLGQVGADEVKPETTAVNSPENVVSDSNLETSASLITRTEVAPTSTVVENTSSEAVSTDTTSTNVASQPTETTATLPASETNKKVEAAPVNETTTADRSVGISSETSDNVTTSQETPSQGGKFTSDEQGNWYYLDSDGHKLTGPQTIDNFNLYFHDNGIQAKGEKITIDGKDYYYDKDNGRKVTDTSIEVDGKTYLADADGSLTEKTQLPTQVVTGGHFQSDNQKDWYYYTANGEKLTGWQNVDGVILYFNKDGRQAKDKIVQIDGKTYYFDKNNGRMVKNQWASINAGGIDPASKDYRSYYLGDDGAAVTGGQDIDGKHLYFTETGIYATNGIYSINGKNYLFEKGQLVKDAYGVVDKPGSKVRLTYTYRTNADGEVLTGKQMIDGTEYVFASDGHVVDGVIGYDGKLYLVKDSKIQKNYFGAFFSKNPILGGINFTGIYGTDENGVLLKGVQRGLDGQLHYFQPEVKSVDKPTWKEIDGKRYRLTKSYRTERYADMYTAIILSDTTLKVDDKTYTIDNEGVVTEFTAKKQFVRDDNWNWYYYDADGKLLTGRQTIDGVQLYFDKNGKQVKGSLVDIDGDTYYFDKDSGAMWTNSSLTLNGMTYEIDDQGRVTSSLRNTFVQDKDGDWTYLKDKGQVATGWQTIDGIQLYFDGTGKQIKGERILIDGKYYYFDKNSGELLRNAFHSFSSSYKLYFGNDGAQVFGWYTLDGHRVYFKEDGLQAKDKVLSIDDNYYYFNQDGQLLVNGSAKSYNSLYLADSEGKLLSGWREIDGKTYYLDPSEKHYYYNRTASIDGKTYLFGSYAELLRNDSNYAYASDENGIVRTGFYRTDKGYLCYLEPRVISDYQPTWKEIDGKLYHFEKSTSLGKYLYGSPITTNATLEKDGKTYVIDENGVATEKVN